MTGYYDPDACGGCRARVEIGQRRCGSCGMRLDEPAAWRLEELLREADALVRELRLPAGVGDVYDPLRPAAGAAPDPAPAPRLGPAAPTARSQGVRLPALSVPAVLLGLGALCVLAAASE